MISLFSYDVTDNTSALLQFLLVPQEPLAANTYTITVFEPSCYQISTQDIISSQDTETSGINFCNVAGGNYLIQVTLSEQPWGNEELKLYINNYSTINYTSISANTTMSFPYYQTTFLKYDLSDNDTVADISISSSIGNARFFLSTSGEGICNNYETFLLSFNGNDFFTKFGGCESVSSIYISVIPAGASVEGRIESRGVGLIYPVGGEPGARVITKCQEQRA
jgi:hypothetical protein